MCDINLRAFGGSVKMIRIDCERLVPFVLMNFNDYSGCTVHVLLDLAECEYRFEVKSLQRILKYN